MVKYDLHAKAGDCHGQKCNVEGVEVPISAKISPDGPPTPKIPDNVQFFNIFTQMAIQTPVLDQNPGVRALLGPLTLPH